MNSDLRKNFEEIFLDAPVLHNKRLYVWGTGNTALLYQEGLRRLEQEGFVIEAYVDNNTKNWGDRFCEKKVILPADLKNDTKACVLICTPQPKVIHALKNQLEELKVEHYHIDDVIFKLHANELLKVYDNLEDEISKAIYCNLLQYRMEGKYPDESLTCGNQYFALPQFGMGDANEVFVDCGAFVGDTLEQYIWKRCGVFKKIIAFEPDAKNYLAMNKRIERLVDEWGISAENIKTYPYALSDAKSIKAMQSYDINNRLGSKIVENMCIDASCQTVTIDEAITEPISFLKADIEGYEYRMLLGAKESIKKYKPRLAICIYHNAVDFYSIPMLIKDMVPEYKMAVRHHSNQLAETVLYAWVDYI